MKRMLMFINTLYWGMQRKAVLFASKPPPMALSIHGDQCPCSHGHPSPVSCCKSTSTALAESVFSSVHLHFQPNPKQNHQEETPQLNQQSLNHSDNGDGTKSRTLSPDLFDWYKGKTRGQCEAKDSFQYFITQKARTENQD